MQFILVESEADKDKLRHYAGDELANRFFEIRSQLKPPYNDLYYWTKRPLQDLKSLIYSIDKKEGLLYNSDRWKIYKITSKDMLNNLMGRQIRWCIQTDGWDIYKNKGTQFYLYINSETGKKYIRGVNQNDEFENGVWGEDNRAIHDRNFINSLPKVEEM